MKKFSPIDIANKLGIPASIPLNATEEMYEWLCELVTEKLNKNE